MVHGYQIPELLAIGSFIRDNKVDTRNISLILKEATDVYHLQSYRAEIKNRIVLLLYCIKLLLLELILEIFTVLNSIEYFKEGVIPIAVLKEESNVEILLLSCI